MSTIRNSSDSQSRNRLATIEPVVGWLCVARGTALFLSVFTLLNLAGEVVSPGFDASIWLWDMRWLPVWLRHALLLSFSGILFGWASIRSPSRLLRRAAIVFLIAFLAVTVRDVCRFRQLVSLWIIESPCPVPFSAAVAAGLGVILCGTVCRRQRGESHWWEHVMMIGTVAAWLVAFPLLQIFCFGYTDYRRPADAAVVFGCRVYSSGHPSAALQDRVRGACELFQQGFVDYLIMSGGPGPGTVHESEAMEALAVELGVPPERILLDRRGLSTQQTVLRTVPLMKKHGFRRVIAVSHYFHLPRIKLAYRRAGIDVFTVPARQQYRLVNEEYQLAREVVALWAYYARPLFGI